jgi:protein TonB
MPEFNGGDEAKIKFLSDNIKYPTLESNELFKSSVYLTFIIDTSGNVTNICVLRRQFSNGYSKIEKEAMRVLTIMPKWTPGVHNGKKVMVRLNIPIKFEPGQ